MRRIGGRLLGALLLVAWQLGRATEPKARAAASVERSFMLRPADRPDR
ncbi:MAG TPA: hypothetical protein VEB66_10355 [Opitutaceae bacterium]|nr:hypothetical protein [Opitutaceae bacterium]